jgi:hypothetical protein
VCGDWKRQSAAADRGSGRRKALSRVSDEAFDYTATDYDIPAERRSTEGSAGRGDRWTTRAKAHGTKDGAVNAVM